MTVYCEGFENMVKALSVKRFRHLAGVAQSVEQRIRNPQVGGSSPPAGSIDNQAVPLSKPCHS